MPKSVAVIALFLSSVDEILNNCTFGENCGGIVLKDGRLKVTGGTVTGTWYRGNSGYRWNTGQTIDLGLSSYRPAAFANIGGYIGLHAISVNLGQTFVLGKSAYGLQITGCQVFSGKSGSTRPGSTPGFHGFIDIVANPESRTALVITGNIFRVSADAEGADTGFVLNQVGPFNGCVFANNILGYHEGATMELPSITAPSLYDADNGNVTGNAVRVFLGL